MSEDDVVVLEEVEADNTVSIEESILPTTRPFISLYGTEKNIVDTPRNVTIVSREQLDAIAIRDARDFSKLTSSAYTQSNFGAPANPSIRGQTADVLINGLRRGLTTNGNGLPTNFNAVESVNILKGPPAVSVGATQYVGGYVDLITKKPNFAEDSTEVTLTADSEGLLVGQVDSNFVVSDNLAYRVSYTIENTDDYFYNENQKRKTHAIYGGLVWKPTDKYRLELNSEYFYADYTENWGWNRITQSLIDNGVYSTGVSPQVVGAVTQSEALGLSGTYGPFGGIDLSSGATTFDISRDTRLLGPDSDSKGYLLTSQAIQTYEVDSDTKIINNTLYQYRDRDTYSAYQYSEVLEDNFSFDNRTEYQKTFDIDGILHKLNIGFATRFQSVVAMNDFFHEPANYWDLNRPSAEIGVPDSFVFMDTPFAAFTGAAIPIRGYESRGNLTLGRPASVGGDYYGLFQLDGAKLAAAGVQFDPTMYTNPTVPNFGPPLPNYFFNAAGNPTISFNDLTAFDSTDTFNVDNGDITDDKIANNGDTNDSDVFQFGFFLQDDIQLNEKVSLLAGARLDFVNVETEDPMYDDILAYLAEYGAAGELARFVADNPSRDSESRSEFLKSANTSLVYKYTDNSSFYLTGNYAESPPVGLGGGISVSQARGDDSFIRVSRLVEAGYKASLLDNTLFLGTAIYQQERSDPLQGGGSVETTAKGFEFELNYQPNNKFYATFGYSFVDATASGLFRAFVAEANTYGGSANSIALAVGEAESPGVPEHLINLLAAYKLTDEFGITLGGVVTSPMNLTYANATNAIFGSISSAEIPWQYSLDAGMFYETDKWALRFNVLNFTDEENFGAVNAIYGNASVYNELPRRYELSASYKF